MQRLAAASIVISCVLISACESKQTKIEPPSEEKPTPVGKTKSHSGKEYDIQGTLIVKDGNVRVQEIGDYASGYSYDDLVTGKRKGEIIRPSDVFIKSFSKTEGRYPYLYWRCHENSWGYSYGSLMESLDSKKMGDKTYRIWKADGKKAGYLHWQQHPHKWSGVNSQGKLQGKDEWGIGSINYSLEGDKYRGQHGVKAFWNEMRKAQTIELIVVKPETSESYYAKWDLPKPLNQMIPDLNQACKVMGVDQVAIEAK